MSPRVEPYRAVWEGIGATDTPACSCVSSSRAQDEAGLIHALRARNESAFVMLIDTHHAAMLRMAMMYVRNRSVAEDVVQETWFGVLRGINHFEARASLKTWIFRILINTAKSRAAREQRSIPLSALWDSSCEPHEPAVEPDRFLPADAPRWPGHWSSFPSSWGAAPEERLLARETQSQVRAAIDALPPSQRAVVTLRDAEGWTAEDVCNVLQITEANQRVLLHRGRSRVRRALELYLTGS